MKKILIVMIAFSTAFTGTLYFGYDTDDSEILSMGYNHTLKQWNCEETGKPSWLLAAGLNYDINSDSFSFASYYLLPMKTVTDKVSIWMSLGYGFLVDDGGAEDFMEAAFELEGITASVDLSTNLTYGLGMHYNYNEKMGFGIGKSVNTIDLEIITMGLILEADIDDFERTNLYFSYKF